MLENLIKRKVLFIPKDGTFKSLWRIRAKYFNCESLRKDECGEPTPLMEIVRYNCSDIGYIAYPYTLFVDSHEPTEFLIMYVGNEISNSKILEIGESKGFAFEDLEAKLYTVSEEHFDEMVT